MTPAQVLASYHSNRTSNVETTRSKDPRMSHPSTWKPRTRIEALLLRPFLAMLVEALIEREIWTFMKTQGLPGIPLHPELRNCPAPSAPRILEILNDVKRTTWAAGARSVQTFQPQLTPLQQRVLDLLHIPASIYS